MDIKNVTHSLILSITSNHMGNNISFIEELVLLLVKIRTQRAEKINVVLNFFYIFYIKKMDE